MFVLAGQGIEFSFRMQMGVRITPPSQWIQIRASIAQQTIEIRGFKVEKWQQTTFDSRRSTVDTTYEMSDSY